MKGQKFIVLLAAAAISNASPFPQGVTAQISPPSSPPAGCSPNSSGHFGISVVRLRHANRKRDAYNEPLSLIADGQVQAIGPATYTMVPVSQIADGQIQAPSYATHTVTPVSQVTDGQIQAPAGVTVPVVSQVRDGQIQAPTQPLVTVTISSTVTISKAPVTQIQDHQIQAPTTTKVVTSVRSWTTVLPSDDAFLAMSASTRPGKHNPDSVACRAGGALELSLKNGVLTDGKSWTGYIASNFQFQFDNPPQAGAIYTSGFTTCKNGSLALGGSTTWWQCLSGNFYNLYDRNWAAQCEPVELSVIKLVDC